jgi:hypothetical protein
MTHEGTAKHDRYLDGDDKARFTKEFHASMSATQAWHLASELLEPYHTMSAADDQHATAFLAAAMLHVAYMPSRCHRSLKGVYEFFTDPNKSLTAKLRAMGETAHDPHGEHEWTGPDGAAMTHHPIVVAVATAIGDMSEGKQHEIVSLALAPLAKIPFVVR